LKRNCLGGYESTEAVLTKNGLVARGSDASV